MTKSIRNTAVSKAFAAPYGKPELLRNVGSYVVRRITNKPEVQVQSSAMMRAFARSFKGRSFAA